VDDRGKGKEGESRVFGASHTWGSAADERTSTTLFSSGKQVLVVFIPSHHHHLFLIFFLNIIDKMTTTFDLSAHCWPPESGRSPQ
jgi:hypothetical protein